MVDLSKHQHVALRAEGRKTEEQRKFQNQPVDLGVRHGMRFFTLSTLDLPEEKSIVLPIKIGGHMRGVDLLEVKLSEKVLIDIKECSGLGTNNLLYLTEDST